MSPTFDADIHDMSVLEHCSHMTKHHEGLREALPRIEALLTAVVSAHADDQPRLRDLQRAFAQFRGELELHLRNEEEQLFPASAALVRDAPAVKVALLAAHERDHLSVSHGLVALRLLASDYDPRLAVCSTHRALLESLAAFESDLRRQIDEEDDFLFPHPRRIGRKTESAHARLAAKAPALPPCSEAWMTEQGHAWARRST